ncbi:MAG: transposase [Gammaproteobacteria bacterium]|nr:transposase [Gammaproteobacteria bacterium]
MSKKRKSYRPEEKVTILKVDKVPVSDLCDQYGIHPALFYRWQKLMFENMAATLEPKRGTAQGE